MLRKQNGNVYSHVRNEPLRNLKGDFVYSLDVFQFVFVAGHSSKLKVQRKS